MTDRRITELKAEFESLGYRFKFAGWSLSGPEGEEAAVPVTPDNHNKPGTLSVIGWVMLHEDDEFGGQWLGDTLSVEALECLLADIEELRS